MTVGTEPLGQARDYCGHLPRSAHARLQRLSNDEPARTRPAPDCERSNAICAVGVSDTRRPHRTDCSRPVQMGWAHKGR
eukprot:10602081-Alexandrium_andersonii.AAC.1